MPKKEKYSYLMKKEKSGWLKITRQEKTEMDIFCRDYMDFLLKVKTEREAVEYFAQNAKKYNFVDFNKFLGLKSNFAGKKIIQTNKGKNLIMTILGKEPLERGINIICSHIDCPRLDLKQNPLYEDTGISFLKTHYYGGIKKFHWLNIPLAIHGKVVLLNGKIVNIKVGEEENDPVFIIPDLLPHLSRKLDKKNVSDAFPAENLNLITGHIPVEDCEKESVKINVLKILNDKYGITEQDFNSAEIEIVPAFKPREIGFDRSMIAGYGHDDRSSAFCSFRSAIKINNPRRTTVVLFIDKEEIGSEGNSSIQSKFFELFLSELIEKVNHSFKDILLKKCLFNSFGISADVDVAFDPNYREVFDINNTAKMGNGLVLTKYTGAGGKYNASDANAEYVGKIRNLFETNNIIFQFGSLGKVDEGGGGTISRFLANYGMEIIDAGAPILGMHSPYEVVSKFDLFQTYKAFNVFLNKIG